MSDHDFPEQDNEDVDDYQQTYNDGEENDGSEESEDFPLANPLNPLGGESAPEEHRDSWQLGLGIVADIASNQIHKATAAAGAIFVRRKTFSLSFHSRSIPFEFSTNPSGAIVVSHVSKSTDERLHRGVIIVGVNDSVVGVSDNASEELEQLLDSVALPFTVVFEELEDEEDVDGVNYEEESIKTESSLDDEEHAGKSYPKTVSSDSTDKDGAEDNSDKHAHSLQHDLAATASSSASLLTSSIFSLTNRMRNLVIPQQEAAPAPPQDQNHSDISTLHTDDDDDSNDLPDNTFELILSTRSPPFVFDLHADGSSIVVVKLVGDRRSMDPRLQEGCVVRLINSSPVDCKSRQEFDAMLMAVTELPMRMVLEHPPALYRHQDALSLFTSASADQAIHVFTVTPHLHQGRSASSRKHATPARYDDVYHTSRRAFEVLQAFRAQGVAVSLVSVETVLVASNCSAYSGTLYQPGSNTFGGIAASLTHNVDLLRAVRVWFRFSEAQEVIVENPIGHVGALEVTRSGGEGTWIVIRCLDAQSVWVDAGMVIGRPYLVTHVNGYDTSASGYRSVNSRIRGDGSWEGSVLPLFEEAVIKFTIV